MHARSELDIQAFLDSRQFRGFQCRILLLCLMILILDGFDVVIMGFIAPALMTDWGVTRESLGVVMSAGLFGLAVGALAGGPVADRLGRRKVIVAAVFFFGLMSFISAWAPNLVILSVLRFLTGLGLGASQPNAATIASEYAPKRYRSLMVTVVYAGFTFGAALGGLLANVIMAEYGWSSVLIVGGVVPMAFAMLLYWKLPESAKYLVVRSTGRSALQRIVNAIELGTADANTQFLIAEPVHANRNAVSLIVSASRLQATLALWLGVFMTLMTVYFLNSWLPIIMKEEGFNLHDAALVGAMFQVGGTLGIIAIGWKMDHFKAHRVLIFTLSGAAVLTVAIGNLALGMPGLMALVCLLGYCINSSNAGWTAVSAVYYPTEIRATGISWMTGIGRFGAIFGAYVGSVLLGMRWAPNQLFTILAVPVAFAIIAAYVKGRTTRRKEMSEGPRVEITSFSNADTTGS